MFTVKRHRLNHYQSRALYSAKQFKFYLCLLFNIPPWIPIKTDTRSTKLMSYLSRWRAGHCETRGNNGPEMQLLHDLLLFWQLLYKTHFFCFPWKKVNSLQLSREKQTPCKKNYLLVWVWATFECEDSYLWFCATFTTNGSGAECHFLMY